MIANNDALHPAINVSGLIRLQPGLYPLRIEHFEATGWQSLRTTATKPNNPPRELPPEWLFHAP